MNYFDQIRLAADWYNYNLEYKCGEPSKVEGFDWSNNIYTNDKIRRGHVELYKSDKMSVLHVTVFPHLNDAAPIYGLDIVSTPNTCLAAFFDLSPTVEDWGRFTEFKFKVPHSVPEWAFNIFSPGAVAIKPVDHDELYWLINIATGVYRKYYLALGTRSASVDSVKSSQNNYCAQQRKNDKTLIALTKMVGATEARRFMDDVLFPVID